MVVHWLEILIGVFYGISMIHVVLCNGWKSDQSDHCVDIKQKKW